MGTDIIDVEAIEEHHHTAVVPVQQSSLIALAGSVQDIVKAQDDYQNVCRALLDDSDIQVIGTKEFKKKSAWRKLGVAFGVTTEILRVTHERNERGRIVRTEVVARATAPNGRFADGIGACDLYERCCDPDTCRTPLTWPDDNFRHAHCAEFPCKNAHFSNAQHDIPATAATRATNRACADLFGMGEVSAEEMNQSGPTPDNATTAIRQTAPRQSRPAASNGTVKPISEGQIKFVNSLLYRTGNDLYDLTKIIGREVVTTPDLTMAEAKKVIDHLKDASDGKKDAPKSAAATPPASDEPPLSAYDDEPF